MKILVLATDYPRLDGSIASYFIHSRNKLYIKQNIDVTVLSFTSKDNYEIEGIKVITLKTYEKQFDNIEYDIVLSHAPNLKNHYRFLKQYECRFENLIFYFHGHEVLRTSKIYPKPYDYVSKKPVVKKIIGEIYDMFKLKIWKKYFQKIAYKSQFIFVSNWMYEMFIKFVEIDPNLIANQKHIIYNCVGEQFENIKYERSLEKKYDFITIRGNLDGSKYGIDIVTKIAKDNLQYKFCVVGKGNFYENFDKPDNLEWIDKNLDHEEIIEYLNKSKCSLLPTRTDAQGVMACEMATFGIPLITSNIDVCKEVFEGFNNLEYIDNDDENIDIEPIFKKIENLNIEKKNKKYFMENTVDKEIKLFRKLVDYDNPTK